jgi:hypothetical protein
MTPEEFTEAAETLFGSEYIAKMARTFGIDARRLRRMRSGDRPIPDGLAEELRRMLEERKDE